MAVQQNTVILFKLDSLFFKIRMYLRMEKNVLVTFVHHCLCSVMSIHDKERVWRDWIGLKVTVSSYFISDHETLQKSTNSILIFFFFLHFKLT
jgi:hypothetical protein